MKIMTIVIMLVLPVVLDTAAQWIVPDERFLLNTDVARFRYDDNNGYVELYISIPRRVVTVQQSDDGYAGYILLSVQVTDTEYNEILERTVTVIPVDIVTREEHSEAGNVVSQMGFRLPFGTYAISVSAVDSIVTNRSDTSSHILTVEPYGTAESVSDLELCSNIIMSQKSDEPFYKNSLEVYPNPSLLFGSVSHPVLFTYSELYNIIPGESYYIETSLIDITGDTVTEIKKKKQYEYSNAVEVNTLNVTPYPSGKYRYRLSLYSREDLLLGSREKTFYLYNPHIAVAAEEQRPVITDEIEQLTAEELIREFRLSRYIASREDIREFDQLTDDEARRSFLRIFWTELEQGLVDREPVRRREYLQRTEFANENYGVMGREGWQTDRGRVYILYGEPDEIERFPSSGQTKPYEIWRFYQIENGVEFVFIDRSGFGEYTLVHSTKRGELRDNTWRQYLR
jgi:GWxTD domain-containing protein